MANFKEILFGSEKSKTQNVELECYQDVYDGIAVIITDTECEHDYNYQAIHLDKSTAIKLSKMLRREINKIVDTDFNPF